MVEVRVDRESDADESSDDGQEQGGSSDTRASEIRERDE
jgi:hypothetical protein